MVRVFIKGGVWKNSEDEILKAAVMKYGKQQWARVASLLNRKSAKQCKARWNEWLDPSVRKVEWSRAEDEKLLHLAKLLPAQWKTIGPLIGRTAAQSQERYERLLDEAAQAAASGDAAGGDGGSTAAAAAVAAAAAPGARRLRPGEIDPHPETKPARPDPVDMDEDEIEMLQEARARLANTQGKKAKRKQREKMLAEAKRLADLQKRRELKQAGLLSGAAKTKLRKRSREIDLGVEIPFHKPAPAGFHDVSDERARSEKIRAARLRDVDYKKVNEDRYRSRDREALASRKREEARLRSLERANMQLVVAEVSRKNDPLSARSRGVLKMPAPTVSDAELEEVAKLSGAMRGGGMMPPPSASGTSVTDALLGDYTDRPLPTPMRTPAHAGAGGGMTKSESVMREAENLRALERGQTPLLGGVNPTLHEGGAGTGAALSGDNTSAASRAVDAPTPRIPSGAVGGGRAAAAYPSATPLQRGLVNQTPVRDELGLNVKSGGAAAAAAMGGDDASVMGGGGAASVVGDASTFAASTVAGGTLSGRSIREMAREERRAAKRARRELELALASLPAPQFEYELAIPETADMEDEDDGDGKIGSVAALREKDAADVEAEELVRLEREAARLYEARSSVLKREGELPRPATVVVESEGGVDGDGTAEEAAEALVRREMLALIRRDAHAHPPLPDEDDVAGGASTDNGDKKKGKKKKKKRKAGEISAKKASAPPTPLEYLPEEALDAARSLLAEATEEIVTEKRGAAAAASVESNDAGAMAGLDAELTLQNCETSRLGADADVAGTKERRLALHRAQFRSLRDSASALRRRSDKLQSRLTIQNGGYERRADQLREEALGHHAALRHAQIEEAVYERLRNAEREAVARRAEALGGEVSGLAEAEAAAQKRYGDLVHERNRLWKQMAVAAEKAKSVEAGTSTVAGK